MNMVWKKGIMDKKRIAYIFILSIGIIVRVYRFGSTPGGINQDEAFAAREAWSLLNY